MTIYAMGDIHGHPDKLARALDLIEADRAREGTRDAPLVQVGDLVDRGPDSRAVVETLRRLVAEDGRVTVLKGNHDAIFAEAMLTGALRDGRLRADLTWLSPSMGGAGTLASYGVDTYGSPEDVLARGRAVVPPAHVAFLNTLPLTAQFDDALLVHAGIRPGVPLEDQADEDLYWIREGFLDDSRDHGLLIVHGHTPVDEVEHHGNRLAIDTGAAWEGPLSAVVIEGRDAFLLTPDGRQPVRRFA